MSATRRWNGWCALFALTVELGVGACTDRDPLLPEMEAARGGPSIGAPSNLQATAQSYRQINFTWQDNASNEDGFEVHRSDTGPGGTFTLFTTYPVPNVTSGGNDGLTGSTQYCYKVRAFKGPKRANFYSAFSNVACATTQPLPVPAAASDATAKPDPWGRIVVSWVDHASDETGFRVQRAAASSGPWTTLSSVGPNVLSSFDNSPPAEEQPACYQVIAFNNFGDAPASNAFCTARPRSPTGLVAAASGSDVDLSWTDNSNVEDGFEIWRWIGGGENGFAIVGHVAANVTTYHDPGLADETYWYQVRATRDGGSNGSSNNASATVVTHAPVAPVIDAIPYSSSIAAVYFGAVTGASGYRVEHSATGPAGDFSLVATSAESWYYDENQPSETELCYRVIAFNGFGDSPASNVDCTILVSAPTGLAAAIDGDQINVTWTDNSNNEQGYQVDRFYTYCDYYECYSQWETIAYLDANVTSFSDWVFNYYSGDVVAYRVFALRDNGVSDQSNEVWVSIP